MTISDGETLLDLQNSSRAVAMKKALQPLCNCSSFMNIGKNTKILNVMNELDGVRISQIYACRVDAEQMNDVTQYWLSQNTADEIDLDQEIIWERLVHIIRIEKPDIVCPTSWQDAVFKAVVLAADPKAYPSKHDGEDLLPWRVKKLYLPSKSAIDIPPIEAIEIVSDEKSIFDNLPKGLVDLADYVDVEGLTAPLLAVQKAIDDAIDEAKAACTDYDIIGEKAALALENIIEAQSHCPDSALPETHHRLSEKKRQLTRVLALAHDVNVRIELSATKVKAGGDFVLTIHNNTPKLDLSMSVRLPEGWETSEWLGMSCEIYVPKDAKPTAAYPDTYFPDRANQDLQVILTWQEGAQLISMNIDPENELLILAK